MGGMVSHLNASSAPDALFLSGWTFKESCAPSKTDSCQMSPSQSTSTHSTRQYTFLYAFLMSSSEHVLETSKMS